jgi:hypothetical protein
VFKCVKKSMHACTLPVTMHIYIYVCMYTFDITNTEANTGLHKRIHTFHGMHNIPDGRPSSDGSSACRFVTVS